MSDLISPNFYSSFNKGTHAPIIGTISKLNSDNDFYFSYASPIIYYARKDMLVNSITTEIRDANFKTPPTLSDFSSVIYQVTRNNTQPLPNPPPLFQKQEIYFKYLQQLAKQEQLTRS